MAKTNHRSRGTRTYSSRRGISTRIGDRIDVMRAIVMLGLYAASLSLPGCGGSGDLADNGGMSGTGISQGSVDAFGSVFVNGVEWDLAGAAIEIEGVASVESDLRIGMVVRVEGDFDTNGLTGTADSVWVDYAVEGPIESAPVDTIPGVEKTFSVLGQTVIIDADATIFAEGASFAGLAADDVVEVGGFVEAGAVIRATRVEFLGQLATNDHVGGHGEVANLVANPDGTGIFDLGSIVVRYVASTTFRNVTRADLGNGDSVRIDGQIRVTGNEVDADQLALKSPGLGSDDVDQVELAGIVVTCAQSPDFCVADVPIDISLSAFIPMGFVPMPGDFVEVEGALVAGTLNAETVEYEGVHPNDRPARIEAEVTSVDAANRTLVMLGIRVLADGKTRLEDTSAADDESFTFGEIMPGDFLEVRGIESGAAEIRASSIEREDATPGADDVRLEGPVTALDSLAPTLSILGQSIPLDGSTLYLDELGSARTEEEFFRNPGDVMLGDVVRAKDESATDLGILAEVDEVEIEGP